jgi:hypothetical protein
MEQLGNQIWNFIASFGTAPWPFIGFLIAIISGSLAMQPFLQMKYGRASLSIGFDEMEKGIDLSLVATITNPPIDNRWLHWCGVRRASAEGVVVLLDIYDVYTGKLVEGLAGDIWIGTEQPAARVTIPPSDFPSYVYIVEVDKTNKKVTVVGKDDGQALPTGLYRVTVNINYGEDGVDATNEFIVKAESPYLHWRKT